MTCEYPDPLHGGICSQILSGKSVLRRHTINKHFLRELKAVEQGRLELKHAISVIYEAFRCVSLPDSKKADNVSKMLAVLAKTKVKFRGYEYAAVVAELQKCEGFESALAEVQDVARSSDIWWNGGRLADRQNARARRRQHR